MREEEIRQLVKIVEESSIADLEVTSWWGRRVKISKYPATMSNSMMHHPSQIYMPAMPAAVAYPTPPAAGGPGAAPEAGTPAARPANGKPSEEIKSPMVGTFYRAPAPDAEPYVHVGSVVQKGQVLCIIEAMKLLNEIEAEFSCRIVEILVENAQPVEYNQPLFRVEKM
jgi:acetyl-CoA carboxylase biotin carboxyl carrier protein